MRLCHSRKRDDYIDQYDENYVVRNAESTSLCFSMNRLQISRIIILGKFEELLFKAEPGKLDQWLKSKKVKKTDPPKSGHSGAIYILFEPFLKKDQLKIGKIAHL